MPNKKIEKLFNFKEQTILITGSSGQIGSSFCKLFLDLGAKVYGLDTSSSNFKHKNFKFKKVNIIKKNIVERNINAIVSKNKKIDVIINNAGYSVFTKFYKRTKKELDKTINVNIIGVLNVINSYVKIHKKKKLNCCNIINIGSIYGLMSPDFRVYGKNGNYNSEIYGATKASIIQLTKYYSVILADLNINVNCLSPGGLYNKKNPQKLSFVKNYSSRVPKARMAIPEDLHTGIIFLASSKSNYVSGQNIIVDGGLSSW
jgi:3-oxoacyl-[acyl-carrier protein] reductase